jgi:hypothetical protein
MNEDAGIGLQVEPKGATTLEPRSRKYRERHLPVGKLRPLLRFSKDKALSDFRMNGGKTTGLAKSISAQPLAFVHCRAAEAMFADK